MTTQVDILVSGAGPVGLYFTYIMSLYGHSVYCVDPKTGPTDQSRAIGITSRTMEVLEGKGLAGEFLEDGYVISGIRVHRKGSVVGQIDSLGDTPFAYMTIVMQSRTEKILAERLESETKNGVHWETELVSYTQFEDKVVSVVLDKRTGQEQTIESRYIIGADGSHSRVRKGSPEFSYDGVAIDTKFFLADLTLKGENFENKMDKSNIFISSSGVTGIIPIQACLGGDKNANTVRIFANLENYHLAEVTENRPTHGLNKDEEGPSLEFVQSFVDKATAPLKFELSDLIWTSYFKINERIVNNYRIKRAILVGDAAHCHSPSGGQGMNLGLQEADNLAWKLSYVLKGLAANPEELLDSYQSERKSIAQATIETTSSATRNGLSNNFVSNAIREMSLSVALYIPQVREYIFKATMQQFTSIESKSVNILGISDKGLIKPGHFLPDTSTVRRCTFEQRTGKLERLNLREIMSNQSQLAVIFIGTAPSGSPTNKDLIASFWNQARAYPIKRIVIESAWHIHLNRYPDFVLENERQDAAFYAEERLDSDLSITSRVGLKALFPKYINGPTPSVLLFVRPDLYVSQSKVIYNEKDLELSLEHLKTLFG